MAEQLWGTDSLGGYSASPKLSKAFRMAARSLYAFRQFVGVETEFGAKMGSSIKFDKISKITTTGGTIAETATVPTAGYTIVQDSLSVTEYGNSVPWSEKLETYGAFDPSDKASVVLRDDMANVIDRAAATEFKSAKFVAVCSTTDSTVFTTNGTAAISASVNMSDKNVRKIVEYMKMKLIKRYGGGKEYISLASTQMLGGLYTYLQALMAYTTPEYMFKDEVGRYYSTRFVEENNVLSNVVGLNSVCGEAIFFGADAVQEGIAMTEELRRKIPTDYGRSKGIAWLYNGGFKKVYEYSTDVEEHIVAVHDLGAW